MIASPTRKLLDRAWRHYWDGNHPALGHVLDSLVPTLPQLSSYGAELTEFWLLQGHLFSTNGEHKATASAFLVATDAARALNDPLPLLAVQLHVIDHALLHSRLDIAAAELQAAKASADALTEHPPEAQVLLGRLGFLSALHAAHASGRTMALPFLDRADRYARSLGREHVAYGIAFGPLHLKVDCTFLLVCFDDPQAALKLAASLDPTRLSPYRQALFLLDQAIAHADLGNQTAEAECYRQAQAILPNFQRRAA
jgi:hypothetical protein